MTELFTHCHTQWFLENGLSVFYLPARAESFLFSAKNTGMHWSPDSSVTTPTPIKWIEHKNDKLYLMFHFIDQLRPCRSNDKLTHPLVLRIDYYGKKVEN